MAIASSLLTHFFRHGDGGAWLEEIPRSLHVTRV